MPTVGIELEFEGLAVEAMEPLRKRWKCRAGDDRTVRGKTYTTYDGTPIRLQDRRSDKPDYDDDDNPAERYLVPSGMREGKYTGLEVITDPYDDVTAMEIAEFVSRMYGHVPQTSNTSIHIHVDVAGSSWKYVQNILRWAYHLEMPILRLASAGGNHRGGRYDKNGGGDSYNDYRFTRPLSAPIGAHYPRAVKPLINMPNLLAASTASEMTANWGRMDVMSNDSELRRSHYVPHRLHMLNLLAVMRQGTMEWRLFDGVYKRLPDFLKLVLTIHKLAYNDTPKFAPILLGSEPPDFLTPEWLTNCIGMDVSKLWGGTQSSSSSSSSRTSCWPGPVKNANRLHHYRDFGWQIPTLEPNLANLAPFMNNLGKHDDGSAMFTLFSRR